MSQKGQWVIEFKVIENATELLEQLKLNETLILIEIVEEFEKVIKFGEVRIDLKEI